MHSAASNGHVDAIKALEEAGGDVSAIGNRGRTAMHCAAINGHVDAIKTLKEAGGNVSAKDANGSTPKSLARTRGHIDAVKVLEELSKRGFGRTSFSREAKTRGS
jgi:cytohesin